MTNGIEIAYNATQIDKAADYSKVLDSRWKFLEVEIEGTELITIPAIASGGASSTGMEQKIKIVDHNLDYFPLYECSVTLISGTLAGSPETQTVTTNYSDENSIYLFPQYDPFDGQNEVVVSVAYRVFRLDVSESYQAPIEAFSGAQAGKSDYGAKFLDHSINNVQIQDVSPVGFSMDTTKKAISIHSVQTVDIPISADPYTVYHYVGYPPTYMTCLAPQTPFADGFTTKSIPHRYEIVVGPVFKFIAYITATGEYLNIKGIQAAIEGEYVFIVLKDPVGLEK